MGDPDIVRGGPRWVELTVHSKLNIFNNRMVERKKRKWKALVYKDGLSHGGDWSFKMLLMSHWAFFSHRCPLIQIFIVPTIMSFILFLVAVVLAVVCKGLCVDQQAKHMVKHASIDTTCSWCVCTVHQTWHYQQFQSQRLLKLVSIAKECWS